METTDYKVKTLTAKEGHYLTQAADVPVVERVVSASIILSVNATAEDYVEIDAEQAEEIRAARQAAIDEERAERRRQFEAEFEAD